MSRAQHPSQQDSSWNGTGRARSRLFVAALGIVGAVALAGCSAGQIAQTAEQESAVNGASADVGPIAIRDATLAPPENKGQFYSYGDDAPLELSIVNTASADDKLVSVSSPIAKDISISGSKAVPGHTTLRSEVKSAGKPADVTTGESSDVTTSKHEPVTKPAYEPPESTSNSGNEGSTGGQATGSAESDAPGSGTATGSTETAQNSHTTGVGHCQIVLTGMQVDHFRSGYTVPVTFTFAEAGKVTLNIPIDTPSGVDKLDTKGSRS